VSASPKKKKAHVKKEEVELVAREKVQRPAGVVPIPTVDVRHGTGMTQRNARGYSMGEVAQAGLSISQARRWGIPVDDRRRSVLGENASRVKKWIAHSRTVTTAEKVEGEIKRIEKVVKKETLRAEKEVEKVEKEMAEVEKKVVRKIEAPAKARAKKKALKKPKTSDG